ncbi:MAG TPA: SDR family NAD(P)-dependent oxidoreductase [Myxococcota bacterium]|jgi:benzil reductase ((S)-benzoin forming)
MADSLVIVSGASSGIGLAMARSAPWPRARVVDVSRRGVPGLEHLAADLADPAQWGRVAAFFERELEAFAGERVVFVHAAGTLEPIGFAGEVDAAAYRRAVLLGSACPQVLGDAFLRAARRTRAECRLLLITSGAAHSVYPGWSAYGAGKAAVDQWARTAGAEQARRGGRVRVLAVAPGIVATAMQEQIRAAAAGDFPDVARFVEFFESGQLREPREVAAEIWALLERELPNGAVVDLRDLAASATVPRPERR